MPAKEIKNVVIYTRVSTEEQAEEGFSLENQKDTLTKYCNAFGYNIVHEFSDRGISGKNIDKRPALKELLSLIENDNSIDCVLTTKLSRLSRKASDMLKLIDFFEDNDIIYIAVTDGLNTQSPTAIPMIQMMSIFSEMEGRNIVSQARSGMAQRAKDGLPNFAPPIGYERAKDGNWVINDKEAEIVRLIFDLYTNKDWGYSRICQHLNRNKILTRKGNPWQYATIKVVLDNPAYVGKMRWGRLENWAKKRRKGTTDDYILSNGKHEAIIGEELWERTRLKRNRVGVTPVKRRETYHLLSGLAKCPECGSAMVATRASRKNKDGTVKTYRYYACSFWNVHKGDVCHPNAIKADLLEAQVIERIKDFINSSNIASELENRIGQSINTIEIEEKIESLNKEIANRKRDENRLLSYLEDEEKLKVLGETKIFELLANVKKDIENLSTDLLQNQAKLQAVRNNRITHEKIITILKKFDFYFAGADHEMKKELIRSLVKEIKVSNHKDINQRKAKEIVLRFSQSDIAPKSDKKSVWFIYDTVRPNLY